MGGGVGVVACTSCRAKRRQSAGTTTDERYFTLLKSAYKIDREGNYLFVLFSDEDDRFSGYYYQLTEVTGYGRSLLKGSVIRFDLESGVGARQIQAPDTGDRQSERLVRFAGIPSISYTSSKEFSSRRA